MHFMHSFLMHTLYSHSIKNTRIRNIMRKTPWDVSDHNVTIATTLASQILHKSYNHNHTVFAIHNKQIASNFTSQSDYWYIVTIQNIIQKSTQLHTLCRWQLQETRSPLPVVYDDWCTPSQSNAKFDVFSFTGIPWETARFVSRTMMWIFVVSLVLIVKKLLLIADDAHVTSLWWLDFRSTQIARFMGTTWAHLGPVVHNQGH